MSKNNICYLYIDGGARGNPGPAASAWILKNAEENIVSQNAKCIGPATNNVAEYTALWEGLKEVLKHDVSNLTVYSDSELLVRQLNGVYKIKNERIREIAGEIIKLQNKIKSVQIKHIHRELNHDADLLVNIALDQKLK